MGTVDVRRDEVEEWLLPVPFTTIGDALVIVSGFPTDTRVTVLGSASAVLTGSAPTEVSGLLAQATVDPFGSVFTFPLAVASAVVDLDNTGSTTRNVALRPAIAVIEIDAPADLVVETSGVAAVTLSPSGSLAAATTADAELEFAYYGDGNFPVFPWLLPNLFAAPQNIQDAAALVEPTGVAVIDAAAGFADVVLPEFQGDVMLTRKGSTPIFPWFLPVVFDDLPANVNLGAARFEFEMDCACAASSVGECAVVFNAQGPAIASAVLPWVFPVILIEAV